MKSRLSLSAFALAPLFLAVGCRDERTLSPVELPPPLVQVALPIQREVTDYETFTARTQDVQNVDIKARVTGYLNKIAFKDGDDVKKDDVLFVIDQRPYKASLDAAKANLEVAKATLLEKQAEYDIGLAVQKENPKAISQQELVRRQGARDEASANVDLAKAQLETAQLNFDWCTVISPIDGRISRHLVDIGNVVSADVTTLANVVSLKPIWAYFQVDENTVLKVRKLLEEGKIKSVRETAFNVSMVLSNNFGTPHQGVVDFTGNQLDPNTGSIEVRATFPNETGFLLGGMFGRISVPIGPPHSALLVDDRAIGTNQSQRFVLVVNEQDEVEYREVDVGQLHDDLREVMAYRDIVDTADDGTTTTKRVEVLKATDRIIVTGLQRVRPGAKVKPELVDMTTLMVEAQTPAAPSTASPQSAPAEEKAAKSEEKPAAASPPTEAKPSAAPDSSPPASPAPSKDAKSNN